MKTGSKIALGCGGSLIFTALAIVGLVLLVNAKKDEYNERAIPFFETCIPELSSWDYARFEQYWAVEVIEGIERAQMEKLFATYSKLGKLRSHEEPQFKGVATSTNNPYLSSVTYSIQAEYENGSALITCILVPVKDDALKVWNLQINSDVFLEAIEELKNLE